MKSINITRQMMRQPQEISRRRFLSLCWQSSSSPHNNHQKVADKCCRPPYAIPEDLYITTCTGCGECVAVCPTKALVIDHNNKAIFNYSTGWCNGCGACAHACQHGALLTNNKINITANIIMTTRCRNNYVPCGICAEECPEQAIEITRGALPQVNKLRCNGCGQCKASCDLAAIQQHVVNM